jgi:adenylate cyclase
VNLAARLESICKHYGAEITVSGDVRAATGDCFEWRYLDRVAVVGRTEGTDIHELLCRKGQLIPEKAAARDAYEAALAHYMDGEFNLAAKIFNTLYGDNKENVAEKLMYERASLLASSPPEGVWTSVYAHTEK